MGWATAARQYAQQPTAARAATDWRMTAAVFALVMMTEPGIGALVRAASPVEPTPWARAVWLPVYAAVLPLIWTDWRVTWRAARATPLLVALLALAVLSAVWSIAPDVTLRRSAALGVTMALAWWLTRFDWDDLLTACATAWSALIIGSFAFALAWPAAGVMGPDSSHPGAWSGLWTQKNMLGGTMGVGVSVLLAAALTDSARRRVWLCFMAAALALVLLSTSATGLLVTLLGVSVLAFGVVMRRGGMAAVVLLGAGALAMILAAFTVAVAPDLLFTALGRDPTLTGRTDIWSAVLEAVRTRPALGHGFGAFWSDKEGPAFWLRAVLAWEAPNAHNGWLELLLALGGAGVALFALQFTRTVPRVASALVHPVAGLIAPSFVAVFVLLTCAEGYILQDNCTVWVMYVAIAAKLALKPSGKESV